MGPTRDFTSERMKMKDLLNSASENVGQASSLTVDGASLPGLSGGRRPPEPADKMSAPHFQTGSNRSKPKKQR